MLFGIARSPSGRQAQAVMGYVLALAFMGLGIIRLRAGWMRK